jgi:hypothetical protein
MSFHEMHLSRFATFSVLGETNTLYMTGGSDDCLQEVSSARFVMNGCGVRSLPDMPEPKCGHVMAVLRGGDIFVAGGRENKTSFLFERASNEWKTCPDMLEYRRNASCGVVVKRSGKEFANLYTFFKLFLNSFKIQPGII